MIDKITRRRLLATSAVTGAGMLAGGTMPLFGAGRSGGRNCRSDSPGR